MPSERAPPADPAGEAGGPASGQLSSPAADAVAALGAEASRQDAALEGFARYFEDQRDELDRSPASWPARGLVTSDFGARLDPYTADLMMHRGLDIATPAGQPVFAPSDATVVFAGVEHGYGRTVVLDHGFGLETRYGHLSRILVRKGERVRRGERIGAVGSTGRSTGPHLHYEVRVNDVAENPRKFIME